MHASQGRSAGLGLALASAFAFGGSGVAAKPLIEAGLDPLHVVWLRVAGAALVMLPLAWRHRDLLIRKPALLAGFGLLAVAGVQACYFAAISRIPVGVALLIEYLAPALVLAWVRFVQRRPVTRAAAAGVVLAVGGLACVVEVWSGVSFDVIGLLLALGAACCQVGYFVLSDQGGPVAVAGVAAATIGLVPALAASGDPDLPEVTAQQLIEKMAASDVEQLSGTVKISTDLGLPSLGGLAGDAASSFAPKGEDGGEGGSAASP
ncbi:EamA family transporter, partial [Streptomyces sp. NPDC005180]|uniref:EamA family transporter n=1 Tax=Streptomyces sp. NPDC005180 TaxID=3156868 RepID=UPI0033B0A130